MGYKWKLEFFFNTKQSSVNDKLLNFLNKMIFHLLIVKL